jgi:ABC-2 type transport system permease protein
MVAATFALVGLVVAIWSEKFEQLNLVQTFVITPLTFLGGVFFSPNMLAEPMRTITRSNPVLYMVEGLRYGIVGEASASPWLGLAVTGLLFVVTLALAAWMLATGYKLRA